MKRLMPVAAVLLLLLAEDAAADVVVFADGTRMSVRSYQLKGDVVVITTQDGKLRSVPSTYINLEATERLNGRPPTGSPTPSSPEPAAPPKPPTPSSPPSPPTTNVAPAAPTPVSSQASANSESASGSARDVPPPVWTNDELGVSLVIPSPAWQVQDMVASFDVAVQLEKQEGQARVTLALIRRPMRDYQDFQEVVREIETSVSAASTYRLLGSGPLSLGPYTAHELRFVKQVADLPVYNRIVAYYSEDLAYVLSLTCPESRLADNRDDFDSLVRGLVIKKAQENLTPRGRPSS